MKIIYICMKYQICSKMRNLDSTAKMYVYCSCFLKEQISFNLQCWNLCYFSSGLIEHGNPLAGHFRNSGAQPTVVRYILSSPHYSILLRENRLNNNLLTKYMKYECIFFIYAIAYKYILFFLMIIIS